MSTVRTQLRNADEKQLKNTRRTVCRLVVAGQLLVCFVLAEMGAHAQISLPTSGKINTLAGTGTQGCTGNGSGASSATLSQPMGLKIDGAGNIYFADYSCATVSKITASTGVVTTVAGNGHEGDAGDGNAAINAKLDYPEDVAIDASGNIYIADSGNSSVRKVTASTGIISTVAGNGSYGYSGDGGQAIGAELSSPSGVALDSAGNLYIADFDAKVIRKVTISTGVITTVVGNGTGGYTGDGGAATSAEINGAEFVAVDNAGNIYFTDQYDAVVRKVSASTGIISTVAGMAFNPGYTGDGSAATNAELNSPEALAVDSVGNLYIADTGNNVIRMVTAATGKISTIGGTGTAGFSGDGGAATSARMNGPQALSLDAAANIYLSDTGNLRIRAIGGLLPVNPTLTVSSSLNPSTSGQSVTFTATISSGPTGTITFYDGATAIGSGTISGTSATFTTSALAVGTHSITASWPGNSGYNAVTSSAILQAVNATGVTVSVSSSNNPSTTGESVTFTATISSGPTGSITFYDGTTSIGAGTISGTTATFTTTALAAGAHSITASWPGNSSYGASTSSAIIQTVNKLTPTLSVSSSQNPSTSGQSVTFTATISNGLTGTVTFYDGSASIGTGTISGADATLTIGTLAVGSNSVTASWPGNSTYNAVTSSAITETINSSGSSGNGTISTLAGTGSKGCTGTGGAATSAKLSQPMGLRIDGSGNVYVADYTCAIVSEINTSTLVITTVAGNGHEGNGGDGGAATSAKLDYPEDVAVDASGNIYIADSGNSRVRKVTLSTGIISTVAGNGTYGYSGDGGAATSAELSSPSGVALDSAGNLYIADFNAKVIRKVTISTGIITTVVGNGTGGYTGDGGAATSAEINGAEFVAVDSVGNIYFTDQYDAVVRKVTASTGIITTFAGTENDSGYSGDGGPATNAELSSPEQVAVDSQGNVYVADTGNNVIRTVNASTGIISTIAGSGSAGYSGDGGDATSAELKGPQGLGLDGAADVYISDTGNYRVREITSTLQKITPTITWSTPAGITYGSALSATQLNATASVGGTFAYSPAAGTVPTAGMQTLSVTFTPTNTSAYNSVTANVMLAVNKATPAITWNTPAPLAYGTAISSTQLDATSTVAGSFSYSPAIGSVLAAGSHTLSVNFGPTDTTDYTAAAATVVLSVTAITPAISLTSATNPSIYGEPVEFSTIWPLGGTGTETYYDGTTPIAVEGLIDVFEPRFIAFNPNTNLIYISSNPNHGESGSVTVINATTYQPVNTLATPAGLIAVNTATNTVYVAGNDEVLYVVDGTANVVTATVTLTDFFPEESGELAVNPSVNKVYVATGAGITVVDGATNMITASIAMDEGPWPMAVNPSTNKVYVAGSIGGVNGVYVIDGASNSIAASIPTYCGSVAADSVTNMVYCASDNVTSENQVFIISGTTNQAIATVTLPISYAGQIAVNASTNEIYVAGYNALSVIDGATNKSVTEILAADAISDIKINDVGNMLYAIGGADQTISVINSGTNSLVTTLCMSEDECDVPALSPGAHVITAQYSGDATYGAATSPPLTQVVNLLAAIQDGQTGAVPYGTELTFSVPWPVDGTGTMSFYDGDLLLGQGTNTWQPGNGEVATFATSGLAPGSHLISAQYSGDGVLPSGTSPAFTQIVGQAASTLTINAIATQTYGTPPFTVGANSVSNGAITYSVISGPATISGSTVTITGVGTVVLGASQAATTDFASATASTSFTVNAVAPSLSVASSLSPSTYGQSVTFTSTISSGPSGSITFDDSGMPIGTGSISGTTASFTTSTLAGGTHSITASWAGNSDYGPATSSAITQTVTPVNAAISFIMGANLLFYGQATDVTVQVSCNSACGNVDFRLDGNEWETVPLNSSGGYTAITSSTLAVGAHTIQVNYLGNSDYNPANGQPQALTIDPAPAQITWATPAAINYGTPLSSTQLNATASIPGTFVYSPQSGTILPPGSETLSVTFTPQNTTDYSTDTATVTLVVNMPTLQAVNPIYSYSVSYLANGDVSGYSDLVMGQWTNINYDNTNRIEAAQGVMPGGPMVYYCWNYDAFGNRLQQESAPTPFTGGGLSSCSTTGAVTTDLTTVPPTDGNNQITQTNVGGIAFTDQYDAAGDITSDGINNYLYDAEGRVCAVQPLASYNGGAAPMTGYLYDADGQRVAKGTIQTFSCDPSSNGFISAANANETDYVLGLNGEQVTELDEVNGTMTWAHTNVWAAGALLGTYDAQGLHDYLNDWLGNRRLQVDYVGMQEQTCTNLPFGDSLNCAGTSLYAGSLTNPTEHHFTGKERDTESGNDYFGARYYASSMGRFLSPDWSAKVMPVPYAKLTDPQTLNLYAYVGNNPLTRRDLDGHVVALGCAAGTSSSQCSQDKSAELQRLAANASKTDKNGLSESSLFKATTDKNGNTTMTLDKTAAANFKGDHSAGYNLLTGAIDAKQTISVEMSNHDSFTGIPDAKGNVTVNLDRNQSGIDLVSPLRGMNGQTISNPFQIIAGHEVLGHAYASDILGLTKGLTPGQEEIWVRQNIENTLRQEQGLPLRDPNSN